jgi:hypothetical protein
MDPKDRNVDPTSQGPAFTIDAAEFIALRTLVTAILSGMAWQIEQAKSGDGQTWINEVSAVCQDALLNSDIGVGSRSDDLRRDSLEQLNDMLKSVSIPSERLSPNN